MRLIIALVAFVLNALAAPTIETYKEPQCPPNALQPDGTLPKESYHARNYTRVSRKNPHQAYRVSTDRVVTTPGDICTICTTIVPYTDGMNCNLVFDLPERDDAAIKYKYKGGGRFTWQPLVDKLNSEGTTWDNKPAPLDVPGFVFPPKAELGNSYVIRSGTGCREPDEGGNTVTLTGMLCSEDTRLVYTPTKGGKGKCPVGDFVIIT